MHSVQTVDHLNPEGWQAFLSLNFKHTEQKTILSARKHHGPLAVQRPFYPEQDVCHVYILHPPGGIVGGDQISIQIHAESDSHALITTPAAGKFYRSDGRTATQAVELALEKGAILEWLPQETIVFEEAKLMASNQVLLQDDAKFLAWEVIAFGRPAAGEGFSEGMAQMQWRVVRDGKTLLNERLVMDANAFVAKWGLSGYSCCGTFLAYPANRQVLERVREMIGEHSCRGVTLIDDILVCRGMDQRADKVSDFFKQVWQLIREPILGRPAVPPRIWAT